jgi:hypothetical protein
MACWVFQAGRFDVRKFYTGYRYGSLSIPSAISMQGVAGIGNCSSFSPAVRLLTVWANSGSRGLPP